MNKLTVADPKPMKTAEDLFQGLGKSYYFTKIDLSKGFWHIPVAENHVKKTAFVITDGNYEVIQMPFEMKNLGATLERELRSENANFRSWERG